MECPFSGCAVAAYVFRNHFNIRTAVDGGSHSFMRARNPRRPDMLWVYNEYLGHWTYLYWFMGLLWIKHPWHAYLNTFGKPPLRNLVDKIVRDLPKDMWHIVSFCGSDHPYKNREKYYQAFEDLVKYLVEEFIPRNPRCRFITPQDLLKMVINHKARIISNVTLLKASVFIIQNWPGRPPTYVAINGNCLNLAEIFQALTSTLSYYHKNGILPKSIKTRSDTLGPIGFLEDYDVLAAEKTVSGDSILATAASIDIMDRIPYMISLETKGPRVNAAELLLAMALEYREIYEKGKPQPVELETAHIEPFDPCSGTTQMKPFFHFKDLAGFTRMNWYTRLQKWTVKPAVIKSQYFNYNKD
jgi:hypothetical protein